MGRFLKTAFIASVLLAQPALAADIVAGSHVFKAQCSQCHATTASAAAGIGPSLAGVVGRKPGTQSAFAQRYSKAMKGQAQPWTVAQLKNYIANPAKVVPGNAMPYPGLHDPAAVANIVAYLATLR